MRIRKYDFDYSRRVMMEKVALGLGGGVLAPAWSTFAAQGEITKAYPDEVRSIELQTKGKIKPGDVIDAKNVEHVKHLVDPIMFQQISTMGRRLRVLIVSGMLAPGSRIIETSVAGRLGVSRSSGRLP